MVVLCADSQRLFFGVEPGDAARWEAAALAGRLAQGNRADAVRWVRPESYHVTLRFLGDTPAERVPDLIAHARRELEGRDPCELHLGTLHAFPSSRRPRVVVLDVEPAEPLAALAAATERAATAAGFAPETRTFRPHLTLGRVRPGRRPAPVGIEACDPSPFAVDAVVLFRSEVARDGAHYHPVARILLQKAGERCSFEKETRGEGDGH